MHVSVITVTYNPGDLLEPTMRSVADQMGVRLDYVVMDGASRDGTVERLQAFERQISGGQNQREQDQGGRIQGGQIPGGALNFRWVSEPDRGLYDAMNKGMAMAIGDYVLFLNAGDTLAHPRVLADLWEQSPEAGAYYGQAMVVGSVGGKELGLRKPLPPPHLHSRSLRFGMVVSHQAFVVGRDWASSYDLQYRICSDIDWMIRTLKALEAAQARICFADRVLIQFLDGGLSSQRRQSAWQERYRILARHYGPLNNLLNHGWIALRYVLRRFVPNFG
jgi:glycosyltransferase involved in cell wall biosynthesis